MIVGRRWGDAVDSWVKKMQSLVGYRTFTVLTIVITGLLLFLLLINGVRPEKYDIQEFHLSTETIRSIKTVEDPVKTEEERQRAASEVSSVYQFSEEIGENRAAIVTSVIDYVLEEKAESVESLAPMEEQVSDLKENLNVLETDGEGIRFTDGALVSLLLLENESLINLRDSLTASIRDIMSKPIRSEQVANTKNEIERRIRGNLEIPESVLPTAVLIGRYSINENETLNEELTQARIEQARASIEPTRILQGQVIVQEGQIIDREVYRQLKLLGMLTNQSSMKPILGLILFISLCMWLLHMQMTKWRASKEERQRTLLVVMLILIMSVIGMKLISLVSNNFDVSIAFLFPTALAPMLVRSLINERFAVLMAFLTAAIAGIVFQEGYSVVLQMEIALYLLFGGLAGLYVIQGAEKRSHLLQTSLSVAVVNFVFMAFYLLMTQSDYGVSELLFYGIAAITSGLLSGALTIGMLPFFESAFGLISTMKLIELSNPNHPLLKKILTETPGTYHHSVMVANLADAACESIGADGLLARVGCYYHDIGKTKRPGFFIENQMSHANPHDSLPPETSRDIILSHGSDGAKLLQKHKMPKEIIDIAEQHHGTSLLKYFYYKAKEEGQSVNEEDYRYAGPKPQKKETAIISIADSVEAAVRSMKHPTAEKIQEIVHSIIKDRLHDGQFDECDLTLKELKTVERVLCETLNGIFHSRIEYPQ
ncbi:HD family phosphohydrolase [Paenisporosarcina quisquiliarum]|uniref:HD family phosphohydrolase n=2 Tax=Paenisporosarcina quisquiliarum TaxID=365346 RepID=A0A9X3RCE3_9BACL|nr:HD family phosphohydrolase [Paenisporosarcina quisquiliarum]